MRYTLTMFVFRGCRIMPGMDEKPHIAYIVLDDEQYKRACDAFLADNGQPLQFDDARKNHKPLVVKMADLAGIHAGQTLDTQEAFSL